MAKHSDQALLKMSLAFWGEGTFFFLPEFDVFHTLIAI